MLPFTAVKGTLARDPPLCGTMILHSSKLGIGIVARTDRDENSDGKNVVFERGIGAYIMAIDGTWRCECTMEQVSATGARLTISRPLDRLNLKEFFLVLSSTGLAFRRCRLERVNGNKISAIFVAHKGKKRPEPDSEPSEVVLL
jgi:hypothetical protein